MGFADLDVDDDDVIVPTKPVARAGLVGAENRAACSDVDVDDDDDVTPLKPAATATKLSGSGMPAAQFDLDVDDDDDITPAKPALSARPNFEGKEPACSYLKATGDRGAESTKSVAARSARSGIGASLLATAVPEPAGPGAVGTSGRVWDGGCGHKFHLRVIALVVRL